MASVFGGIEIAPPIEVFNLTAQYNEDNHPQKVNLGVGGKVKVKGWWGWDEFKTPAMTGKVERE